MQELKHHVALLIHTQFVWFSIQIKMNVKIKESVNNVKC